MSWEPSGRNRSGSAPGRQVLGSEGNGNENRARPAGSITQELVNQVADKVYTMLLADLGIEQERARSSRRKPFAEQGGW